MNGEEKKGRDGNDSEEKRERMMKKHSDKEKRELKKKSHLLIDRGRRLLVRKKMRTI